MKCRFFRAAALAVWMLLPSGARAAEAKAAVSDPAQAQIVRRIDDPGTGRHWLLERDPAHPGGPGRLIAISRQEAVSGRNARALTAAPSPFQPVIRAGDRLIVTQETAVVSARLEAVALEPAGAGREFKVRLKFGGKVLEAVALGSGRAALLGDTGGWR